MPRFSIAQSIDSKSTTIRLKDFGKSSWKAPFRIRVGTELLEVKAVEGDSLDVVRGIAGTNAETHPSDAVVEILFDKGKDEESLAFDQFEQLIAAGPFAIPDPPRVYKPRWKFRLQERSLPGELFKAQAKVRDWDPSFRLAQVSTCEFRD